MFFHPHFDSLFIRARAFTLSTRRALVDASPRQ